MLIKSKSSIKLLVNAILVGVFLGVIAQLLRQMTGALMYLGASTTPWVMDGFLLGVLASREARTLRKAFLVATASVAIYLFAWLVSYHVLFVIRESVSLAAGWRQAAPWILLTVPISPIIGIIAAMSHKRGFVGDCCLVVPFSLSIPEAAMYMKEGWLVSAAIVIPTAVLASLLIYIVKKERPVRIIVVLTALIILCVLGIALFPDTWFML